MIKTVSFPGLGLEFTLNRVAFTIPFLNRPVYWYGVIIVSGLILAVYLCSRWGKRFGITEDNIIDMMLFAVPAALVAIRVYYVVFNLDMYRQADGSLNWGRILNYGDGGLAIYGAIISSAIVLLLFCRRKKLSFLAYADLGVHGLFIGQLIGRWGNFMNVEAFGSATTLPWRMCGPSIAAYMLEHGYVDQAGCEAILSGALGVHPTFFYESAWNFVGLIMVDHRRDRRRNAGGGDVEVQGKEAGAVCGPSGCPGGRRDRGGMSHGGSCDGRKGPCGQAQGDGPAPGGADGAQAGAGCGAGGG